jgi:hypothetical protein
MSEKNLNLTVDERAALTKLVRDTITADPYPLSPRIRRLKALLAKLDQKPEPLPEPAKRVAPRGGWRGKRRR